jgi:quercetin dioxygenase-like cupin family protein
MKSIHTRLLSTLSLVLAACALTPAFAASHDKGPGKAAAHEKLVSLPASDLKWREIPGTGGIRAADVRGSITGKGPYEAFVEFPAGKNNPHHFHTQNLPTVVLSGVFYAIFDDGKKIRYPAGSYYYIPGKLPHLSGCEPGASCVLFQYQNDHFDLVPVPGTAK